ncbi:Integrase [Halopseudomonas xinjiangensis]|uniref:Integrase n=2 Tax=Halopseudomonas xinjiangensis TaxID=487184 RepID=A0A1H1QAJ2_9GAMM|nr:Integrase [Halopseudomonas xinjiangensis]
MACVAVALSDAEIKRQAEGSAAELRDPRHTGLRLRFRQDRAGGSWFLIKAKKWHKLGTWPELPVKTVVGMLPEVRARLAADPGASFGSSQWRTVGELLEWYRERSQRDRGLSAKRRAGIKSMVDCHMLPRLKDVLLADLDRPLLDRKLMWPLQEELSLSYTRQVLRALSSAFKQALRLQLIPSNPLDGVRFVDFVQTKVKPKAARLHAMDVPRLLLTLQDLWDRDRQGALLALMMLCHGTRIGETRQARWRHISLSDRVWIIPAEVTKTRTEHQLPLTAQVCALLERYRDGLGARHRDSAFVFPATPGKCLSEKGASEKFCQMTGGNWSSHDLRKLARTGWAELGVDYLIGEMLLNHQMSAMARTYIQTSADTLKREALERWHEWLDARGFTAVHGLIDGDNADCAFPAEAALQKAAQRNAASAIVEVQTHG